MGFEDIVGWALSSEEFENMDIGLDLAGEQMTSIWENNLSTVLVWKLFVLLDAILEDIHHPELVEEAQNDLETSWMEGNTEWVILVSLTDLKIESHGRMVAPNLDSFISWGGND